MKKHILLYSFLMGVVYSLFVGVSAAQVAPVDPLIAGSTFFVVRTIYLVVIPNGEQLSGSFMAGVNKEIWIDKLKEKFYSNFDWLDRAEDWSQWVEYNTINFTNVGANPTILKNNSSWPIVAAQRTDTNSTVVLDTYDSTTTRIYNVEAIEASIDKLESVTKQHRSSLMQEIVSECLFNYAPATAAAGAYAATGSNRAAVIGSQSSVAATLKLEDIASLQERWDAIDAPQDGRVIVLNPYHRRDLMAQDIALFKAFTDLKKGEALPLFGIDVYVASNVPLYTKSTLAIKAYGAAADNTNDCVASVAFITSEVMKAMGDIEVFYKEKGINPEQRADEIGFQMRFKGTKQRAMNNLFQAIVSNRA